MSAVFRGKFTDGLKRLFRRNQLEFHGSLRNLKQPKLFRRFLRQLWRKDWVVYAKKPFRSPAHVLQYLSRYTHRVAISNHRLVAFEEDKVTFRWKDYVHGNRKRKMTLAADEFLHRFLTHVLPRGFTRIRHFGLLANRRRRELVPLCRRFLGDVKSATAEPPSSRSQLWSCPMCHGPMVLVEKLSAVQIRLGTRASGELYGHFVAHPH